jgi:diphthine-ammonia ligase
MRVLALLSGGKDSVAAVEVAQGWGWEVVAALAMVPAADDAWMFHTPNLAAVRGVAQCLGIPLLEAPCRTGEREEVEDLEAALAAARRAFALDGIVSGALASEYQRTRIDAIGHRLGLRTFAPLWHKEAGGYLRSLVEGGYRIRFSRAAGIPLGLAGQPLDAAAIEAIGKDPHRPDLCGEGGEYETLVLDAPHFRRRLLVEAARLEATASRATWVVEGWHTAPRTRDL